MPVLSWTIFSTIVSDFSDVDSDEGHATDDSGGSIVVVKPIKFKPISFVFSHLIYQTLLRNIQIISHATNERIGVRRKGRTTSNQKMQYVQTIYMAKAHC